jgi:eukaryotic-like serine/threonine-protein kinase
MGAALSGELGTRFSIERTVGGGAAGAVYRGRDRTTGRPLAIKVLHHAGDRARFLREAEVLATLVHPHIVRYLGHGVSRAGEHWIAMEWLEGSNLYDFILRSPVSLEQAVALGGVLARVLAWLHGRGLVHRDLKPGNVFLVGDDVRRATLLDFGIARARTHHDSSVALTPTGSLMGTPEYMPPEQISDSKRVDARADVFALGCILYHALTRRSPFAGHNVVETLHHVLYDEPRPIASLRPDLPPDLADLLTRMMSKRIERRPRDGAEVSVAIEGIDLAVPPDGSEFHESVTAVRIPPDDTLVTGAPETAERLRESARIPGTPAKPPQSMTRVLRKKR